MTDFVWVWSWLSSVVNSYRYGMSTLAITKMILFYRIYTNNAFKARDGY